MLIGTIHQFSFKELMELCKRQRYPLVKQLSIMTLIEILKNRYTMVDIFVSMDAKNKVETFLLIKE